MFKDPRFSVALVAALAGMSLGLGDGPAGAPASRFDPAAARKLAETTLDEARGKPSRERYDIVWPEGDPRAPALGDEVVLIGGYISNYIVVFRWTGDGVEENHLSMARTWFYNRAGENFATASLPFPPEEFATRWAAARLVAGATTRRKGPAPEPPEDGPWGGCGVGSHTPEQWVRLWPAGSTTPLFLANNRGTSWDWEEVRDFEEAKAQVIFSLFHEPFRLATLRRGAIPAAERPPIESWRLFLRRELQRFLDSKGAVTGSPGFLLLEVCLRGISMAGDASDLPLVRKVDTLLAPMDQEDYDVRCCREEDGYAVTRLRLRWEWDPAFATEIIRGNPRERHAQNDLSQWTRSLFQQNHPGAYRDLLLTDLKTGMKDRDLFIETIAEVARCLPREAKPLLDPLRGSGDPEVEAAIENAVNPKPNPANPEKEK